MAGNAREMSFVAELWALIRENKKYWMLPILIVSDVFAVWTWWGGWHLRTLANMLPGAVVGVAVGWATAHFVTDDLDEARGIGVDPDRFRQDGTSIDALGKDAPRDFLGQRNVSSPVAQRRVDQPPSILVL
jgi:hypothetical protein